MAALVLHDFLEKWTKKFSKSNHMVITQVYINVRPVITVPVLYKKHTTVCPFSPGLPGKPVSETTLTEAISIVLFAGHLGGLEKKQSST